MRTLLRAVYSLGVDAIHHFDAVLNLGNCIARNDTVTNLEAIHASVNARVDKDGQVKEIADRLKAVFWVQEVEAFADDHAVFRTAKGVFRRSRIALGVIKARNEAFVVVRASKADALQVSYESGGIKRVGRAAPPQQIDPVGLGFEVLLVKVVAVGRQQGTANILQVLSENLGGNGLARSRNAADADHKGGGGVTLREGLADVLFDVAFPRQNVGQRLRWHSAGRSCKLRRGVRVHVKSTSTRPTGEQRKRSVVRCEPVGGASF
jgi:hypothetical protein